MEDFDVVHGMSGGGPAKGSHAEPVAVRRAFSEEFIIVEASKQFDSGVTDRIMFRQDPAQAFVAVAALYAWQSSAQR